MVDFSNEESVKATWDALAPAIGRLRSAGRIRDMLIDGMQYFLLSVIAAQSVNTINDLKTCLGVTRTKYVRQFILLEDLMETSELIRLESRNNKPTWIFVTFAGTQFLDDEKPHAENFKRLVDVLCSNALKYAICRRRLFVVAGKLKAAWASFKGRKVRGPSEASRLYTLQHILLLDVIDGFNMVRGAPISKEAVVGLLADGDAHPVFEALLADLITHKAASLYAEGLKVEENGFSLLKTYGNQLGL